jgi:hypothetical protein
MRWYPRIRWRVWPPLDELIGTAQQFYPGGLAESETARGTKVIPAAGVTPPTR